MLKDYVGFGALNEALLGLAAENFRRIFVVASATGWRRFNSPQKRKFFEGKELELFSDFSANPDFSEITAGCQRFKSFKPDCLMAIGGGSAMDTAKAIKAEAFTREPYDPNRPETIKPSGDGPPLVAIATTAGSGSEATQYAVFYLGTAKQSLAHASLRPEMAVVDPELTYTLPPSDTAATGLDALSQAVEARWAAAGTPESVEYAEAAIRYALPNLSRAVRGPDPASRYHMAQAAYLAGKAINITRTTLPHALAYHLTKRYGLAHGHAVAVTLPCFFVLNTLPGATVTNPGGQEAHRASMERLVTLLGQESPEGCMAAWRKLLGECGLAATLKEVGLTEERQVRELVASANPARAKNHPVELDPEVIVDFFMKHS